MVMRKIGIPAIILLILTAGFSNISFSQSESNLDGKILLRKELAGHVLIHTSGWGLGFRKAKHISGYRKWFYEGEIVSFKDKKEVKMQNPFNNGKSYVFGKLNYVYNLRLGAGFQKEIHGKPYWGGVQIKYLYSIGASVAFLRPYYLYVYKIQKDMPSVLVEQTYNDTLSLDLIYGRGSLLSGFDKLKVSPGAYGRFALNFEFGKNDKRIIALEAGATFDCYFIPVAIMANNTNKRFFFNLYLALQYGKRYN